VTFRKLSCWPAKLASGRSSAVALLAGPQGQDIRIVGGPFGAAVPAQVIVRAVPVVLAIGLIVLMIVTHQVP